jgi:hypothetical protein
MKILKVLGIVIALLAAIILIGGQFLPKTYSVNRSTTIDAPDSVVYKNIADFNEFYKWNPWAKMEPTAKTKISGPVAQPDHLYEWVGKETGEGYMRILEAKPNSLIDIELKFIEPFENLANTRFDLVSENNVTKVTWTMTGKYSLLTKWMCFFVSMDKMIGGDFESGLKSLKEKSEQN